MILLGVGQCTDVVEVRSLAVQVSLIERYSLGSHVNDVALSVLLRRWCLDILDLAVSSNVLSLSNIVVLTIASHGGPVVSEVPVVLEPHGLSGRAACNTKLVYVQDQEANLFVDQVWISSGRQRVLQRTRLTTGLYRQ